MFTLCYHFTARYSLALRACLLGIFALCSIESYLFVHHPPSSCSLAAWPRHFKNELPNATFFSNLTTKKSFLLCYFSLYSCRYYNWLRESSFIEDAASFPLFGFLLFSKFTRKASLGRGNKPLDGETRPLPCKTTSPKQCHCLLSTTSLIFRQLFVLRSLVGGRMDGEGSFFGFGWVG